MRVSMFPVQPLGTMNLDIAGNNQPTQTHDSFSDFLKANLNKVSELQREADTLAKGVAVGDPVDIHQAMIASEKALVAMQLTVQIRNRIVEAYQELNRMQI